MPDLTARAAVFERQVVRFQHKRHAHANTHQNVDERDGGPQARHAQYGKRNEQRKGREEGGQQYEQGDKDDNERPFPRGQVECERAGGDGRDTQNRELQRVRNGGIQQFGGDHGAGRNGRGKKQAVIGGLEQGGGDKRNRARQQQHEKVVERLINRLFQNAEPARKPKQRQKPQKHTAEQTDTAQTQKRRRDRPQPPRLQHHIPRTEQARPHQQPEHKRVRFL